MRTITMSPNGRLTLPAEVRQRLGLEGETEFDVEVTERGSVTLRPVVVIPRDDAWAYAAEHLAAVARALSDIREAACASSLMATWPPTTADHALALCAGHECRGLRPRPPRTGAPGCPDGGVGLPV